MDHNPIITASLTDIPLLIPVILELRPHLTPAIIQERLPLQFQEGYRIVYIGNEEKAFCFAGFRINLYLYSGKTMYIDDLATLPDYRNKGYAKKIFDYLKDLAKRENCAHFSLDSGFQRTTAHKFYLNQGLKIEALHFGDQLIEKP